MKSAGLPPSQPDNVDTTKAKAPKSKKGSKQSPRPPKTPKDFSKDGINPNDYIEKFHSKGNIMLAFPENIKEAYFEHALYSMFKIIEAHQKKPQEKLIAFLNCFVDAKWNLIYCKLQHSQASLKNIDQICFQDTDLSLSGLRDLYKLYCQFQDKGHFPNISIDITPAEQKLEKFKKEVSTTENKSFLEKLVFDIPNSEDNGEGHNGPRWQKFQEG